MTSLKLDALVHEVQFFHRHFAAALATGKDEYGQGQGALAHGVPVMNW